MFLVQFNNSLVHHISGDVLDGLLELSKRLLHALVAELVGLVIVQSLLAR